MDFLLLQVKAVNISKAHNLIGPFNKSSKYFEYFSQIFYNEKEEQHLSPFAEIVYMNFALHFILFYFLIM